MTNKQPRKLFNFYFDTLIDKVEKDEPVPEFQQVDHIKQKPIKTEAKQNKSKKTKNKMEKENQVSNVRVKSKLEQLIFKANNNEEILSSSEQRQKRKKSIKKEKAVGNVRLNIFNIIQKTNKGEQVKEEQLILSESNSSDDQIVKQKKLEEKQQSSTLGRKKQKLREKKQPPAGQKKNEKLKEYKQQSAIERKKIKLEKQQLDVGKKKQNIKTQPITETKRYSRNQQKDKVNLNDVHLDLYDEEQEKHYKNMRIRKAKILLNSIGDQNLTKKLQKIYNYNFQTQDNVDKQDKKITKQNQNKSKNYHLGLPKAKIQEKKQLSNTSLRLPAIDNKKNNNENKYLNKSNQDNHNSHMSPRSIQLTPQKKPEIQYQRYNGKNVFQSPPVSNKWNRSIMDIPPNQKVNFSQNDDAAKRKAELLKQSRMHYLKSGPTGLKNQFKSYKMGRFSQKDVQQEQD